MRETPDAPYVHDLVAHVGPEHQDIVLSPAELLAPGLREAVLHARDLPVGMGDMDTSLYLLFRSIRQRSTVALSGESADEVFGGYRWFHDPEAIRADTFPWMVQGMRGRARGGVVSPALEAKLDLDGYRRQRYAEAIAEVPRLPGETGLERRMREVCYLHLTRFVQLLLDRKDRMSMAVGLEVRVPFCDHRLVEYVFNTPWAMKTFDGREKSLLRAAARDVLPDSVAERVKSPYPATQDPEYERALRAEVAALLGDPGAPAMNLLDPEPLRAVLDKPLGEVSDQRNRFGLEMALQLNTWLTTHDVALTW
jgi:asparagine synthase (glutamine-hydrolysing)